MIYEKQFLRAKLLSQLARSLTSVSAAGQLVVCGPVLIRDGYPKSPVIFTLVVAILAIGFACGLASLWYVVVQLGEDSDREAISSALRRLITAGGLAVVIAMIALCALASSAQR